MPPRMTSAGSAVEFERHREPLNDVGAVAGDGGLGDRDDRALARAGIIFGDDDDEARDHKAEDAADEEVRTGDSLAGDRADRAPTDNIGRRNGEAEDRKNAGGDEALVKGAHDRAVGAELDEKGADDRGHDAGGADRERVGHGRDEGRRAFEEDRRKHHGRDDRHYIGLEQIGGHSGAVADIVAYIVGDGRGIARVVLGNASLDLADEVGADVGALGEDAAAETGEDRDQRCAEAERDQRVHCRAVGDRVAENARQHYEIDRHPEKREAGDEQAGHRAGAESDVEAARERFCRRLRGAHVGAHRDVHADEAGGAGEDGSDGEADRHRPRKQKPKDDEYDDADAGDGGVLAPEVGLRPFRHRARDFLHARRADIGRHQTVGRIDAVDDGKQSTDDDQAQKHARKPHCKAAGFSPRPVSGRLLPETALRRNGAAISGRF